MKGTVQRFLKDMEYPFIVTTFRSALTVVVEPGRILSLCYIGLELGRIISLG